MRKMSWSSCPRWAVCRTLISCEKRFEGRVPRTEYSLTAQGRKALADYVGRMESVLRTARRTS